MKSMHEVALEIAIRHTPEIDLPAEYKPGYNNSKPKKKKEDSKARKVLEERALNIKVLLQKLTNDFDQETAYRFATSSPKQMPDIRKLTDHPDFTSLNHYLHYYKKDFPNHYNEIGTLSMLLYEMQRNIEIRFNLETNYVRSTSNAGDKPKREIKLKDPLAQELYENGSATIDGVFVKFWQGHSYDTVKAQQGWNKIKSYAELNEMSLGLAGNVVFSGIMQITRNEISQIAISMGFKVHSQISSTTNYFVIGSENVGPDETVRYIRAKEKGCNIKIMNEIDFLEMAIKWLNL